jgi:hypothetical protein
MIKGTYTMEQGSTSFNKCDGSDVKVKALFCTAVGSASY